MTEKTQQNTYYDIVIVGGGMVGVSQALLLAAQDQGWSIALLEKFPMPEPEASKLYQASFDARSTAISLGSMGIFQQLGLWDVIAQHSTAINTVHVSDKGHFGGSQICAREEQVEQLGAVVENAWLGKVLLHALQSQEAVDVLAPMEVNHITMKSDSAVLRLSNDTELQAGLLLLADGGDSELSRQLGIAYDIEDYQQHALIANIESDKAHNGVAYERFTDCGPMALLPLGESDNSMRSALVWTIPQSQLEEILGLSDEQILERLQQRFGYRQGRFLRISERHQYPLQLKLAKEQLRRKMVVLGNAAHYLHPVAGQGFNLALRDCAALSEVLLNAKREGKDLGELQVLQQYLERQSLDQSLTVGFSDQLVKLFSSRNPLLQAGRGLGFLSLALFPELKKILAEQTMGLAGRKARLATMTSLSGNHG